VHLRCEAVEPVWAVERDPGDEAWFKNYGFISHAALRHGAREEGRYRVATVM